MSDEPTPLDPNFRITLPDFEGPLDLLLHLIQKHELNILDLPIAFVTQRYLAYIDQMQSLNLDIASEYLLMAATLAHIKSKMLLPPDPNAVEEEVPEDELDPRAELIRRLLEYQKYKQAASELGDRPLTGRDVYMRGTPAPEAAGPAPLAEVGIFALLDAFESVVKRLQDRAAREVIGEGMSLADRMSELTTRLTREKRVTFDALFDGAKTTYDLVLTFLAILEMAKRRLLRVYQTDTLGSIHIEGAIEEAAPEDAIADTTTTTEEAAS